MRDISETVLGLLDQGRIVLHAAYKVESATPQRVWSGYGSLTVAGETYTGIGATNLVCAITSEVGQAANPVTLALSGVDPQWIPSAIEEDLRGKIVSIYALYFDEDGTSLLDTELEFHGTVDQVMTAFVPGDEGSADLNFNLESEARGSQRSGGRLAAGQDQRLIASTDGSMDAISVAGDIVLYWDGAEPQRAAVALK
jgi:hypothetical protein